VSLPVCVCTAAWPHLRGPPTPAPPLTPCLPTQVTDTTGAGDLFAAGFLYGLLKGYPARRCGELGCIAGGAVVQTLGAEMGRDQWSWLHQRMHGRLAGEVVRDSAAAVQREMLACYSLIERKGRGVVYYGSARLKQDSPHWDRAVQLGRNVAQLLGCTTWSGGGPGMMEAATIGALRCWPCCAVLCCAVLCCAVLCCADHAVLCWLAKVSSACTLQSSCLVSGCTSLCG
jgi:hypothetical protein